MNSTVLLDDLKQTFLNGSVKEKVSKPVFAKTVTIRTTQVQRILVEDIEAIDKAVDKIAQFNTSELRGASLNCFNNIVLPKVRDELKFALKKQYDRMQEAIEEAQEKILENGVDQNLEYSNERSISLNHFSGGLSGVIRNFEKMDELIVIADVMYGAGLLDQKEKVQMISTNLVSLKNLRRTIETRGAYLSRAYWFIVSEQSELTEGHKASPEQIFELWQKTNKERRIKSQQEKQQTQNVQEPKKLAIVV